jgi:hypothetical protein
MPINLIGVRVVVPELSAFESKEILLAVANHLKSGNHPKDPVSFYSKMVRPWIPVEFDITLVHPEDPEVRADAGDCVVLISSIDMKKRSIH